MPVKVSAPSDFGIFFDKDKETIVWQNKDLNC